MKSFPWVYDHFIIDKNDQEILETWVNQFLHGRTILDLGCGTGQMAYNLAKQNFNVTAIDAEATMIEYAQKHRAHPNIRYRVADMRYLESQPYYDAILILNDGLNYLSEIQDVDRVIQMCTQSLKPNGVLIFDVYDESVLTWFKEEHLEQQRIDDLAISWSIWVENRYLSHVIHLQDRHQLTQQFNYVETIFPRNALEAFLIKHDFKFKMFYDFNEHAKEGLKCAYVGYKT